MFHAWPAESPGCPLYVMQGVLLVELYGGHYNRKADTLTYTARLLSGDKAQRVEFFAAYKAYKRVAGPKAGHTLSLLGPVSLFIDDCSSAQYYCYAPYSTELASEYYNPVLGCTGVWTKDSESNTGAPCG